MRSRFDFVIDQQSGGITSLYVEKNQHGSSLQGGNRCSDVQQMFSAAPSLFWLPRLTRWRCVDSARVNVHTILFLFFLSLCVVQSSIKGIYSSKCVCQDKVLYCRTFNFMFWSLKIKYTSQVCINLSLQCFCQRNQLYFCFAF